MEKPQLRRRRGDRGALAAAASPRLSTSVAASYMVASRQRSSRWGAAIFTFISYAYQIVAIKGRKDRIVAKLSSCKNSRLTWYVCTDSAKPLTQSLVFIGEHKDTKKFDLIVC